MKHNNKVNLLAAVLVFALLMIWQGVAMGVGLAISIVLGLALAVLMTFFPVAITVFDGFKSVKTEMRELMFTFGAGKGQIFLKLKLPAVLPYFFSALKMAIPLSVIGEWLGAQSGLGYFSRRMMTQLDGAGVFEPILLLSPAAMLLVAVVSAVERRVITVLALTAALLSGCGSRKQEDEDLRKINVVLDRYPNALHTFIYTAIERGYYAEEGLDVHIQFPANENDALFLSEKNITGPADLVGKTVGYAGIALSEALVHSMMEAVGENMSNVEMVNVGFELMSAMTTGNVDATIGCLVNHEVPQMEEEGFEVNWFLVNEYGIPNYYEAVFLANNDMIEKEADVLQGFLRASARGFGDFKADPDGCLQILLNNQNEENFPLLETVETQSCQTLLPLMETAGAPFLSQTAENWQENINWMYASGLINQKVEVSQVMAEFG